MTAWPDYTTARDEAGFAWSCSATQGALMALTGVPIREFNLDPAACIEAYRRGRPLVRERYGPEVGLPGITTPAVSYGHVNCLGCELTFPAGGEVGHAHLYGSLDEGLAALRQPVDFARSGLAPFFLDFRAQLQAAFPDEKVGFSFGLEGPVTTAWELRGDGLWTDLFDRPERTAEFLDAAVDSIVDYHRWTAEVLGVPPVSPHSGGMCDDLSSFVPPRLFERLVVPYWDRYYRGLTTGRRHMHVEDLRPEQLPFLEQAGIYRFDPSISAKLNPRLIRDHCRVPFLWRIGSFHLLAMTAQQVEDCVFRSAADGASGVITHVAGDTCDDASVRKFEAFRRAAKEAKGLLEAGAPRAELAERVSREDRQDYWAHWWPGARPLPGGSGVLVDAR